LNETRHREKAERGKPELGRTREKLRPDGVRINSSQSIQQRNRRPKAGRIRRKPKKGGGGPKKELIRGSKKV